MDRRSFIKLTAVSGTTAALASCGDPDIQMIRFVPDDDIIPGQATVRPSVCPLCAAGCGLDVRLMGADHDVVRGGQAGVVRILAAKKLEGRADHPVSRGALCARGQAAIQVTYHPDRITQPLRRTGERGEGQYEAIAWDEAIAELTGRLNELQTEGRQRQLAYLMRPGPSLRAALVSAWLARFGAPSPTVYELFGDDVLRRANGLSFGREQVPTVDLANARFVLNFGADLLGTWNAPVAHSRAYGEMRQGRPGIRGMLVQVESRMSQTGASADEWVPARPGTEGVVALGLAHIILGEQLRPVASGRAASRIEGWSGGLADYTPEEVERITGVTAARLDRLARTLATMSPAVAVIGGPPLAHTNGLFAALAVNALNELLGSVEQPGGVTFMPQMDLAAAAGVQAPAAPPFRLQPQADSPSIADAQVVIIDGANPVFTAPPAWKVREALAQTPYIVSVGSFLDETSALADLILPDHSFLESWTDALPEAGAAVAVVSAAPPAMSPLHQTRSTPDVLLEVGRQLATPIETPWQTYEQMLEASFAALPPSPEGFDAWAFVPETGGWWGELPEVVRLQPDTTSTDVVSGFSRTDAQFDGDAETYPFHFLPYASNQFLDGSLAHLPWLQEMPDPLTSAMWSSWVEINPATAARLGIAQGDVVDVASAHGTVRTAAMITPGIAPDLLAMPVGQGHTTFTRYASGRGENPVALLSPLVEPATGAPAWAATRVRIARAGEPDGRLILFAGGMREHADHGR